MRSLILVLAFLAQPFWEARDPAQWTDQELRAILDDSPWAVRTGPQVEMTFYLATARPVEEAQAELLRRERLKQDSRKKPTAITWEPDFDYQDYLRDNREANFVLAIPYPSLAGLGVAREMKRLEEETAMLVGRKTYGIEGYFPPTPSDPVLRIVFPRRVELSDKTVVFRLYLPGVKLPEREVEFRVKDMVYRGKLEM